MELDLVNILDNLEKRYNVNIHLLRPYEFHELEDYIDFESMEKYYAYIGENSIGILCVENDRPILYICVEYDLNNIQPYYTLLIVEHIKRILTIYTQWSRTRA